MQLIMSSLPINLLMQIHGPGIQIMQLHKKKKRFSFTFRPKAETGPIVSSGGRPQTRSVHAQLHRVPVTRISFSPLWVIGILPHLAVNALEFTTTLHVELHKDIGVRVRMYLPAAQQVTSGTEVHFTS